jgi:hypothetical protein
VHKAEDEKRIGLIAKHVARETNPEERKDQHRSGFQCFRGGDARSPLQSLFSRKMQIAGLGRIVEEYAIMNFARILTKIVLGEGRAGILTWVRKRPHRRSGR